MRRIDPRTRKGVFTFRNKPGETIMVAPRPRTHGAERPPLTGENYGLKEFSGKKVDLKDCTFIIPVSHDSVHRRQNLDLCINHLLKNFDTHIIVGEQGTDEFEYTGGKCLYVKFDYRIFHRTRMLNQMTKIAGTRIVFNWDADVFIAPAQIWMVAEMIRGGADFVYPYDGRFARVPRSYADGLNKKQDVGIFAGKMFEGMQAGAAVSVGGAIGYSRESFFAAGGENEHFVSYSPEDAERKIRFERLGHVVKRVAGPLYHLDHYIGVNSSHKNPFFEMGNEEYAKVIKMQPKELATYIKTWPWIK